ncbi:hypothetical protein SAMN04488543_1521 [Friedmanniella luteola]|uniref:Uncharacterized protein n=1 Tax=Friedmanniella luteola TaxID=546871 RepID=A0A1H1RB93_9ACTN|nr:hypothetical protein [Friedmanniella luteola]SDS33001.1 hypothetical protein SAMN04488543_1521 [Friedmanniella luteola]
MDVTTLEAPQGATAAGYRATARPTSPTRAPGRPRRRTGRGTGPQARPARPLAGGTRVLRPQACAVDAPAAPAVASAGWRLTERGIALVLVTALLIVTAAVTVVGLTALRVTGERYADAGRTVLVQP